MHAVNCVSGNSWDASVPLLFVFLQKLRCQQLWHANGVTPDSTACNTQKNKHFVDWHEFNLFTIWYEYCWFHKTSAVNTSCLEPLAR